MARYVDALDGWGGYIGEWVGWYVGGSVDEWMDFSLFKTKHNYINTFFVIMSLWFIWGVSR